jgi:hypothetical protein
MDISEKKLGISLNICENQLKHYSRRLHDTGLSIEVDGEPLEIFTLIPTLNILFGMSLLTLICMAGGCI